jgi:hypothetical protein
MDSNANPQGDGQDNQGGGGEWRAQLKDDLKGNEYFTKFQTISDLGKQTLDLEGRMKEAIFIPNEKATDADKAVYLQKLGIPETPDKYDLPFDKKANGYSEDIEKWYRDTAHKLCLDPKQAKGLLDEFLKKGGQLVPTQQADMEKAVREKIAVETKQANEKALSDGMTALKGEWGGNYDLNLKIVDRAVMKVEEKIPGFKKAMDESGFGNNPHLVKAFHFIGQGLLEGSKIDGQPAGGSGDSQGLRYPSMEKLKQ